MSLHDVRGHDEVRRSLARAREAGTLPQAMLIHGAPGVGKQRLALWIAQLLLCGEPGPEGPCGTCRTCRMSLKLEHPDLHWHMPLARPKKASSPDKLAEALEDARGEELVDLRIDPLRPTGGEGARAHYLAAVKTIRGRAQSRPSMSDTQIFILGDAETLVPQESSPEAANSMLKLLEEPPGGTRFILTSSEPGRVLATVRSRCHPLHLGRLPRSEVEGFLTDVAGASADEAARAAALADGSIGRGLGFLPRDGEPGVLEQTRLQALGLVRAALGGPGAGFEAALDFAPAGARGLLELFAFVEGWIRDLAAVAAGAPESVTNRDHLDELRKGAGSRTALDLARAVSAVEDAREQARGNVNPQLIVAGLVARLRRGFAGGQPGSAGA